MGKGGFRQHIPEEDAGFMLIVRTTPELDVIRRRDTAGRVWRDVVELEERGFAAPAGAPDERAASLVAPAHLPPDSRRYVASPATARPAARSRGCHTRKPSPLEIVDQQRQGAIENRVEISIRHGMPRKRLGPPQLFMCSQCQR